MLWKKSNQELYFKMKRFHPEKQSYVLRTHPQDQQSNISQSDTKILSDQKTTIRWHQEVNEGMEETDIQGSKASNNEASQPRILSVPTKAFLKEIHSY